MIKAKWLNANGELEDVVILKFLSNGAVIYCEPENGQIQIENQINRFFLVDLDEDKWDAITSN